MDAVIRFQPDTLRDALWRPLAMAAPDADVYVEIMAPDVRFVVLLVLTVLGAVLALRRRDRPGPLASLLAFAWLAFIPWLATTGNGRYFIVVLLLVGPLCIALIYRLPVSRNARVTLCIIAIVSQVVAVTEVDPRRRWALLPWGTPYLDIALTRAERDKPAGWVIISGISHSLVVPQFNAGSRWVNLSFLIGDANRSADDRRARQRLEQAHSEGLPLKLLVPTYPQYADPSGLPVEALRDEINRRIGPYHLGLAGSCEVRVSGVMAKRDVIEDSRVQPANAEHTGFWVCPLAYPVPAPANPPATVQSVEADAVFNRIEQMCPRLFPPGSSHTVRMLDGYKRDYSSTDLNAYILDNGDVFYMYWRALNPNYVGTRERVIASDFQMNCNQVHGRSGLPWERKL